MDEVRDSGIYTEDDPNNPDNASGELVVGKTSKANLKMSVIQFDLKELKALQESKASLTFLCLFCCFFFVFFVTF